MKRRVVMAGLAAALSGCLPWVLPSALAHSAAEHDHLKSNAVKVSSADYTVPDVWLQREDGQRVKLTAELDDGRPVVLNFVYTTCPGICPMMSQVFSQFQANLAAQHGKVHMVSISIDPEQDTPARLRAYARQFGAGSQWQHYTGTVAASIAAQKAFDAYNGDKMAHDPLTLMRAAPGAPWIRLDGFATADDLLVHYKALTASRKTASATP
jgi:protein SCO1/2